MEQYKEDCIFCKIIQKEIPSEAVYEDDHFFAFLDSSPINPGHTLVVPKKHVDSLFELEGEYLKKYMAVIQKLAQAQKSGLGAEGVNIHQNNGAVAGQSVFHIHFHVIPRFEGDGFEHWQGKPYEEGQAKEIVDRIVQSV